MEERPRFNADTLEGSLYLQHLCNQLQRPLILLSWRWMRRQVINVLYLPGKDDPYYELDAYALFDRIDLDQHQAVEIAHITGAKALEHRTVLLFQEIAPMELAEAKSRTEA